MYFNSTTSNQLQYDLAVVRLASPVGFKVWSGGNEPQLLRRLHQHLCEHDVYRSVHGRGQRRRGHRRGGSCNSGRCIIIIGGGDEFIPVSAGQHLQQEIAEQLL